MEALLPALVACLLAETGGRVQLSTESYAANSRALALLAALFLSTIVSLSVGAAGGAFMARMVTYEARTLLLGLALILTGGTLLIRAKADPLTEPHKGAPLWRYLATQLGDNSQFIVFAFAARGNAPVLAAVGGLAGVMLAGALPLMLDGDFRRLPIKPLRRIAGGLLLAAGLVSALHALELI